MRRFVELKVWQRSHELVLGIYRLTQAFAAEERFGVTLQLRRAATSVAANMAEGSRRQQPADCARLLNVAEGSLAEVEYLLMLSCDLGYAAAEAVGPRLDEAGEIFAMLHALRGQVEGGSGRRAVSDY